MRFLRFHILAAILCAGVSTAAALPQQTTSSPSAPPDVLLLVHQEFQFGKENDRQRLDMAISRACAKIDVPNSWIDLESVTGKRERLSFDPFDTFAQMDDAVAAWPQIFGSHPDLARMQEELQALETNERTIIATRRSDLSYQSNSIDLSKARFMRVLEVQVRPGHDEEFADAFRILRAAYLKIRADLPWVVYQVNVGMPSPTFLAFVPMSTLKQNDDLLSWRGLLREAEGESGANRMQQVARDAYIVSESNLYAIAPEMSHVSKEFASGDPAFWSLKPGEGAQPDRHEQENVIPDQNRLNANHNK